MSRADRVEIKQIISHEEHIYGLSIHGDLYVLVKGFIHWKLVTVIPVEQAKKLELEKHEWDCISTGDSGAKYQCSKCEIEWVTSIVKDINLADCNVLCEPK